MEETQTGKKEKMQKGEKAERQKGKKAKKAKKAKKGGEKSKKSPGVFSPGGGGGYLSGLSPDFRPKFQLLAGPTATQPPNRLKT